jgi:hypothetical protein
MKKILFAVTLLTFSSSIFAQSFNFGIKGGINSQKITTDSYNGISGYTFEDFKADAENGYNVGLFARIGAKKLYIQPELLYSNKKGTTSFNLTEAPAEGLSTGLYSQAFDVRAIQIPFLLGYRLIDLKLVSIRAFTGPAMSIILNNTQIKLTGPDAIPTSIYDPKTFKNNVWNWQLGGGVDIGPVVLDVRYEWGLTNVSEGDITKVGFVSKGNTLTFSLGYKFL